MSGTEEEFWIWFWNKSANKTNSDVEEKDNDINNNENLEKEYLKTKREASYDLLKQKLK